MNSSVRTFYSSHRDGRRSLRIIMSVLISIVIVATAVLGLVWHLSNRVLDQGPLGDGNGLFGRGSTCLPTDPPFRVIAIGYAAASNTSSRDVIVDQLNVSNLNNVKVLHGALVMPFVRSSKDGVQYGQVHSGGSFTPARYKDSQPLAGAKIPRAVNPNDALLYMFGFAVQRVHEGPASFGDATVSYHTQDGQEFRVRVVNGPTRLAKKCS